VSDVEKRLAALERRLLEAEDRLAIINLVTTYGPCVDHGDVALAARSVWVEDGTYDLSAERFATGHTAIEAMVNSERHRAQVQSGIAHIMAPPHIQLNGDTAVATAYSTVMHHYHGTFIPWRVSVNRFELVRTASGWKVQYRLNRLLDGQPASHQLLRDGVTPEGKARLPTPPRRA
jgi:hypothetical protein